MKKNNTRKYTPRKVQKRADISGQRFGQLVVVGRSGRNKSDDLLWVVECDCGQMVVRTKISLVRYQTNSCGNHVKNPLYNVWRSMVQRCYDRNFTFYHRYGGRGIYVCEAWRNSFVEYLNYIDNVLGPKLSPGHSIDRIDNDSGYRPGNIRWATSKQQVYNSRTVKPVFMIDGNKETFFNSARTAYRKTGVDYRNISTVCQGKRIFAGGKKWRYATDEEARDFQTQ